MTGCKAREAQQRSRCCPLARVLTRRVVELALLGPVEEALPLVPVIDEYRAGRITGHAHENPVTARGRRTVPACRDGLLPCRGGPADERDLDGAVSLTRTLPRLRVHIDAEFLGGWLGGH